MNARIIQIVCAFYMVAMSLAAGIHWWSLRDVKSIAHSTRPPSPVTATPQPIAAILKPTTTPVPPPALAETPDSPTPSSARDAFYTSLLHQIENLQNQNRDLIDQLADTNRELMKLEFRVDTHSSQFRPLPVTEERQEASIDDSYGVLPPRPIVIDEPFAE
jgi:hypothetical protein